MNPETETEFLHECRHLVASIAVASAETLPLAKRIMIYRGLADLFPSASDVSSHARKVADTLATAEQQQLVFTNIVDGSMEQRDEVLDSLLREHIDFPSYCPDNWMDFFRPVFERARSLGFYSSKTGLSDAAWALRNRAFRLGLLRPADTSSQP